MNKYFRLMIAVLLILGIAVIARDQVAWAGFASGTDQPALAQIEPSVSLDRDDCKDKNKDKDDDDCDDDGGSVKPPPSKINVCKDGSYSVGGVATLNVQNLAPDYCLKAFLRTYGFPRSPGKILADVTFLQVYYRNHFIHKLPTKDGSVVICYAVPPGRQAKIYFSNSYGRESSWKPLPTTVANGIACAPAQTSGAYALIGK